jgi:hypothetical protein
MGMVNLVDYEKKAYVRTALFPYRGTTALKKGFGMCFDMDYLTTETGETATDAYGARGMKEIAVPSASNANRFAGVLTQDYPARANGVQLVELYLPGGCAMVAQRIISTSGVTRLTCIVDQTAGDGLSGMFGHGGLSGRGSAIALQTLAAATSGNLALTNATGTATGVYSAATGLTTVTLTGAGTALGYVDTAVDASGYELTVLGGAVAATGHATVGRATEGVYPVVQATGADTFTVTGNTGDAAMTTFLTKANLLMLAYLEDGQESGLSEYVTPKVSTASQFVLTQGGTTFVLGGLTMAGDSTATLADPITIGGLGDGARKAFYALATNVTSSYLVTVTSGLKTVGTALANVDFLTAGEWIELQWAGNFGPGTAGLWRSVAGTATEA